MVTRYQIRNYYMPYGLAIPGATSLVSAADYGLLSTNTAAKNDVAMANAFASVASGGAIGVPFGAYRISQSMIIDNDNVSLIGFGERGGAPSFFIDPSADPSYALIVGNTKVVNNNLIQGLEFVGRNNTTSTGAGILFRSNLGKIQQCRVGLFGGLGISVCPFSGALVEVFFHDVDLLINGMNALAHALNLFIHGNVADSEFHRVIAEGDISQAVTTAGIDCEGTLNKFIDCHCYYHSASGIFVGGDRNQSIGGEYETNVIGIQSIGQKLSVIGIAGYGNSYSDIKTTGSVIIADCNLQSVISYNIVSSSPNGGIIADNILSGAPNGILLDTGSSGFKMHDNDITSISDSIQIKATNSDIHDNTVNQNIVEQVGAQNNNIHDNQIAAGKTIIIVGTQTKVRNNPGHNPKGGNIAPTIPASNTPLTNTTGYDVTVFISGGTLSNVAIGGVSTGGLSTESYRLPVGQSITLTYTVAPTWTWFGD